MFGGAVSSSMSRFTNVFSSKSAYEEQQDPFAVDEPWGPLPDRERKARQGRSEASPTVTPSMAAQAASVKAQLESELRRERDPAVSAQSDAVIARKLQEAEIQDGTEDPELAAAIRESLKDQAARPAQAQSGSQQRERSEKRRSRRREEGGSFNAGFDFPADWASTPGGASTRGSPGQRSAEPLDPWPPATKQPSPKLSPANAWPPQLQAQQSLAQDSPSTAKLQVPEKKERKPKPAPPPIVATPYEEKHPRSTGRTRAATDSVASANSRHEPCPGQFDEAILAALAALPRNSLVDVLRRLREKRPEEVGLALGLVPSPSNSQQAEASGQNSLELIEKQSPENTVPVSPGDRSTPHMQASPANQVWQLPPSSPAVQTAMPGTQGAVTLPMGTRSPERPWGSMAGDVATSPAQPAALPATTSAPDVMQAAQPSSAIGWPSPTPSPALQGSPPPLPPPASPPPEVSANGWGQSPMPSPQAQTSPANVAEAVAAAADAARLPSPTHAQGPSTGWPQADMSPAPAWPGMPAASQSQPFDAWPTHPVSSSAWPVPGQA
eukprot:TRINITY_DN35983_c0_g1_i1.p1 TRINITY_DN35983_c0_g1~~TRINITY_DN35983_c0_g1_i1.p1  ORF type:complete len:553 (-),score=97.81 TRINITY_DN35983_c0_g1_i1:121-1779(-)